VVFCRYTVASDVHTATDARDAPDATAVDRRSIAAAADDDDDDGQMRFQIA